MYHHAGLLYGPVVRNRPIVDRSLHGSIGSKASVVITMWDADFNKCYTTLCYKRFIDDQFFYLRSNNKQFYLNEGNENYILHYVPLHLTQNIKHKLFLKMLL